MNTRSSMKWLKRITAALALLLALALVVPFFIPLDSYIPLIEKQASASLRQPVTIKHLRLGTLPLLHVTLDGIKVGDSADIMLDSIEVTPDLLSLLQQTRVIKHIDINGLSLTQQAIGQIAALGKSDAAAQQPATLRIENVRLHDARINFGKLRFGPFDTNLKLDNKGNPERASITTQDGKLKAGIKLAGSKYLIDASAKAWTLPAGPALMFDQLHIKGTATLNGASLEEIEAMLYGGSVIGRTSIDWQHGLQLNGKLDISHLEVQQISAMLSPGTRVSGKLDAQPVFAAAAPSAALLKGALRLETPFDVQNGVLNGVDIEKAATSMSKQESGGETRFQKLSGHLQMEHGAYHFSQLRIASGSVAVVDGNVDISPQQALSGRIQAQVKAIGKVPLNVGGTVDKPLLYPTGGTMTGAAIGTMILGPGVGTSLGAKVGGWAEGLFGKKKKEPQPKK